MSTPASVNGKLLLPDGTAPSAGSFVQLDLKNIGTAQPTVDGVAIYNQKQFTLSTVDGSWSGSLYRNDNISCNGVFNSVWAMTYFSGGRAVYPAKIISLAQTSADLDTLPAINLGASTLPVPTPSIGATSALAQFPNPASTWTCVHNFGTQAVTAQFYDLNWNELLPDTAVSTNVNTFTATFLQPQAGVMVVMNVGNWTPSVTNPNYIIGNPTSSQSITGDYPFTFGGSVAAKRLESVRYADQFGGIDIGAKINAAIADLPSTGGTVYVAAEGESDFTTPIVINKPIRLVGLGIGSTSNANITIAGPTSLWYKGSTGDAITITAPGSTYLHGVVIEQLSVFGNKAAGVSGNGLVISGGNFAAQLTRVVIKDSEFRDFKNDNIVIRDNAFIIRLDNVNSLGAGGNGLHVFQTGLMGTPSQLRVTAGWYGFAGTDGIRFDAGYAGGAWFSGVTVSNNSNNGATFASGAIHWYDGDVEGNTLIGLFLNTSLSILEGPNCFGNGSSGIWLGSSATLNTLIGLTHDSNGPPDDLHIVAGAADNVIINPSSTMVIFDAGTRTSFISPSPNLSAFSQTVSGPIRFVEDPVSSLGTLTGFDYLYGDNTTHKLMASYNNDAFSPLIRNSDLAGQLVSPPAIGGTTPAAGTFTTLIGNTSISGALFKSTTECFSNAAPNPCVAKPTGMIVQAAGTTSTVVNTTAVSATSSIFLQEDASIGGALGVTCNVTPTVQPLTVTARTNSTSFTFSATSPTTNPRCLHYWIIN